MSDNKILLNHLTQLHMRIVADLLLYYSLITEARIVRHLARRYPEVGQGILKATVHQVLVRLKQDGIIRHWTRPIPYLRTAMEPTLVVSFSPGSGQPVRDIGMAIARLLGREIDWNSVVPSNSQDLLSRLEQLKMNAGIRWSQAVNKTKPLTVYAAIAGARDWLLQQECGLLSSEELPALVQLDAAKVAHDPVGAMLAAAEHPFDQPHERFFCGLPVVGELGITDLFLRWESHASQPVRHAWRGRLAYDHTYLKAHGDYHALLQLNEDGPKPFGIDLEESTRNQFLILVHVSATTVDYLRRFLGNAQKQQWCAGVAFFLNDVLVETLR